MLSSSLVVKDLVKEGSNVLTELKRGSTVLSSSLVVKDLVQEGSSVLTELKRGSTVSGGCKKCLR